LQNLPPSYLDDSPVLVMSARVPMLPNSEEASGNPVTKLKSSKMMWGALQTVQTVCDYIFRKHNLFTFVRLF
jgi:hypothetical protein